jgi:hypothetical protein
MRRNEMPQNTRRKRTGTTRTKKQTARPRKPAAKRKATKRSTKARRTADPVRDAWSSAVETLQLAHDEAERQVVLLLKKHKIGARDASGVVKELRKRFEKERKKAIKQLEAHVSTLQSRVDKEKKAVSRVVDHAVKNALAAFNIPSRQEVARLTRKVDQLSKKIDTMKRRR